MHRAGSTMNAHSTCIHRAGQVAQPSVRPPSLIGHQRRSLKTAATNTLTEKPKLSYVGVSLATSEYCWGIRVWLDREGYNGTKRHKYT